MTSEPTPPVVHEVGAGAFLDPVPPAAGPQVTTDPNYAWGAPIVAGRVSVDAVVGMFRAESIATVADEYGLTVAEVEAAIRYRLPSVDVDEDESGLAESD